MSNIYRQGQTGDVIKQAQQALADRGLISQKDVTGVYDKTTAKAIKTFKTNTNGSNTYSNTFGKETLKKLLNSSGSSQTTTTTTQTGSVYQDPQSVSFDADAWKQAYIDTMVSQLQSNYNTDKANLDKTFNTNLTNYQNQLAETNQDYDANIQALQRQRYQDSQEAKNVVFSRGLGNGGLGQAIEQTANLNAVNKIADTQNERTRAINNINTLINQVKYNYGIDSDTLLKNFNADKLKYMSTAELNALEKQLEVDMHNTDWSNKFLQDSNNRVFESSETDKKYNWQAGQNELDRDLQVSESQKDRDWKSDESQKDRDWKSDESQKDRDWKSDEAQKDRDAQTALAKLQASYNRHYGGSGYGSGSKSSPNSTLAANYLEDMGVSTSNATAKALYWDYISGNITWNEFKAGIDSLLKNGSGVGGGGSANKGSGAGRRTSSNSVLSKLVYSGSGSIPDKKGLNSSKHRPSANKKSGSGRKR